MSSTPFPASLLLKNNTRLMEFGFRYLSSKGLIKAGFYVAVDTDTGKVVGRFAFQSAEPAVVNVVNQAAIWEYIYLLDTDGSSTLPRCYFRYAATSLQYPDRKIQDRFFAVTGSIKIYECSEDPSSTNTPDWPRPWFQYT